MPLIACSFSITTLKKDFSVDPDIQRMQVAGHNMIRHLTAGMAMITCREPLLLHISNNLKSAFTVAIRVIELVQCCALL